MKRVRFQVLQRVRSPGTGGMDEKNTFPNFAKGAFPGFAKGSPGKGGMDKRVRSPGKGGMDKKGAFSNGKGGRDEWVYSPMVREGEGGFTKVEESKKPC